MAFICTSVIRGGKNPLVVLSTSNTAEASGVVVPMPVWADTNVETANRAAKNNFLGSLIFDFILVLFEIPLDFGKVIIQ